MVEEPKRLSVNIPTYPKLQPVRPQLQIHENSQHQPGFLMKLAAEQEAHRVHQGQVDCLAERILAFEALVDLQS